MLKKYQIFGWLLSIVFILSGCGGYEDLNDAEKTGLNYVIEMHTASKRNPEKLSLLMGRTKTKEGIAHIQPFLQPSGTVWVGSAPTDDKDKTAVYIYFSPEMTTGPIIHGVYVEKRGNSWIYMGDIALENSFDKVDFSDAEETPELKKLKVTEWTKVDIENEQKK